MRYVYGWLVTVPPPDEDSVGLSLSDIAASYRDAVDAMRDALDAIPSGFAAGVVTRTPTNTFVSTSPEVVTIGGRTSSGNVRLISGGDLPTEDAGPDDVA